MLPQANRLFLFLGLLLIASQFTKAQTPLDKPVVDYHELKGLLLRHKGTVGSMLGLKRFKLISSKEKPESTIYAYQKDGDSFQILVRLRKSDGLASEIAWHQGESTLGSLTHDAVIDGFVPVAGNSRYYNRFQKMALFVNYSLADKESIPCLLRTVE